MDDVSLSNETMIMMKRKKEGKKSYAKSIAGLLKVRMRDGMTE